MKRRRHASAGNISGGYGHEQSEILHRIGRSPAGGIHKGGGGLSNFLSIFANSGANILTINQTIPTNGCAGVTISAETSEMVEDLEAMMARVSGAEGVLKFEVQAA